MFYSTDLLLKNKGKFALIWRLATTRGYGRQQKEKILAVKIKNIVEQILEGLPSSPLTADQQKRCLSLRLISHLLYGTCIVFEFQAANLATDATLAWNSCRHIRFDELLKEERHPKKKARHDKRDEDYEIGPSRPKKRRTDEENESDFIIKDDSLLHSSQVFMGMEFLDRALISRSRYDLANITLQDDAMPLMGGMNDPMFIQNDLEPQTDEMLREFLNGGEDISYTTKESSENRTQQSQLRNADSFREEGERVKRREEREESAPVERHRASSHVSHLSGNQTGGTLGGPLMDDMMMMDELNLTHSMAGIEEGTRTSLPPQFVGEGPLAVSSQVDPALQPILPEDASQILPAEILEPMDVSMRDMREGSMLNLRDGSVHTARPESVREEEERDGREERRRDVMDNLMMVDEMRDQAEQRERRGGIPDAVMGEAMREEERDEREREEREKEEPAKKKKKRGPIMDTEIMIDRETFKAHMEPDNWKNTLDETRNEHQGEEARKRPEELMKFVPTMMGRELKNKKLNELSKLLKLDRIILKEADDLDDLLEDEEDSFRLPPLVKDGEEEEERRRRREEEEEERPLDPLPPLDGTLPQVDQMGEMPLGMDATTMMGQSDLEEGEEHMSVATIEGDWSERVEYHEIPTEMRIEERELDEEARRRLRDELREEEEEDVEQARRRRTTGAFSDGLRMGEQSGPLDLLDQPMMNSFNLMGEEREERMEEERREEGEEMVDRKEYRSEAGVGAYRDKKRTFAGVTNEEARQLILDACEASDSKEATFHSIIPELIRDPVTGMEMRRNAATAARMFYNMLVMVKNQVVVPHQSEAYGTITLGLCPHNQFPVFQEVNV